MIKLLWNSQNQNKPNSNKSSEKDFGAAAKLTEKSDSRTRDYAWGIYHKKNSDKWIYEILNKIKFESIQSVNDLEEGDVLVIIDSSIEKKNELYSKLKLICSKTYMIHLGDEGGPYDFTSIYSNFSYVWRTFCSNKYFSNNKVGCLPLGYKSGTFHEEKIVERKYKWSFIGTPHKSSRHDLLYNLSNIKPAFIHKTKKFNEKIIEIEEMRNVLSSTIFVPCPNGFVHPETYRLYEALECGCIPIVENAYKYYDRLFPGNPFLKIDKWQEAKDIINKYNEEIIEKKRKECLEWWQNQKTQIQKFIGKKINNEKD